MTLGQSIRAARLRAGLSQARLAPALGVDRTTLAYWELDAHEPSVPRLRKLRAILDISWDDLMSDGVSEDV